MGVCVRVSLRFWGGLGKAEMELAVAKPALLAAQEAVNCLDKASLTELKSFSKVSRT